MSNSITEIMEASIAKCQSECDRNIKGAHRWRRLQFLAMLLTTNSACIVWEIDWFKAPRWQLCADVVMWIFIIYIWCNTAANRVAFHREWKMKWAALRDDLKKQRAQWQGYGKENK